MGLVSFFLINGQIKGSITPNTVVMYFAYWGKSEGWLLRFGPD